MLRVVRSTFQKTPRHTHLRFVVCCVNFFFCCFQIVVCRLLDVQEQAISTILGKTVYKRHVKDDVLCKQGELANDFFIIVSGQCSVQVTTYNSQDGNTVTRRVGNLLFDACCDVHNVDTTTVAMFSIDANVHIHVWIILGRCTHTSIPLLLFLLRSKRWMFWFLSRWAL